MTLMLWVPMLCLAQQQPPPQPSNPAPATNSDGDPIRTSITVTERITAEAPAQLTVLDPVAIAQTPGINLDDRLRMVPGFSLFRRSSSLVANPTTQGVSLRGLGSTGASRTLVLWDGIPLNDPFGGWVYWTRVPPEYLQRVEVTRTASTSLFGDRAMGGAISLFSREPGPRRTGASYEFGNRGTHQATAGGSHQWRKIAFSGIGRAFTTDGYYIVPDSFKGPIDDRAAVRFVSGIARVDYLGARDRFFTRFDLLAEERPNGTRLQRNSTGLGTISANYHHEQASSTFSVLGYHTREEFRASFSAIGAGRLTERLTMLQSVPAEATGGAALWRARIAQGTLFAGADAVRVEGYSNETLVPSGFRTAGGIQSQFGAFVQGDYRFGPAMLHGGLRRHVAGAGIVFWSPSGGVSIGTGALRWRASGYRSFRAPTLNELFREFRVGNAVTLANAALRPETLAGGEAGVDWRDGETVRASFTAFYNELDDLITNVTLSSTGGQITRQRRNAAAARTRGIELELSKRWGLVEGEVSYLFSDGRFSTGERIPQTPRHQGSAQLTYACSGTIISGGLRATSFQFEDDRNVFPLAGYAVWTLALQRPILRGFSATMAFENLFHREFVVGFSPTPLIGAPRLWRIGLRWDYR